MINFLIVALKVIFLLGFLVFIHESGHFLVAKLCKVKVNEFAIGFGPTIWKNEKGETKYALRLIPLGGFVSMEGEEEHSEKEGSFSKTSIPKRMAIVAAGGIVNIVFALLVYFILMTTTGNFASQKIEKLQEGYAAIDSGIMAGDEIIQLGKKRIRNKSDITKVLEKSNGSPMEITVKRNQELLKYTLTPTKIPSKDTGIYLGAQGEDVSTKIVGVYPNSPSEQAGIETNDIILAINGKEVGKDPYKVVQYIAESEGEVDFTLQRKDDILHIKLTPNMINNYYLGVQFEKAPQNLGTNLYYAFWDTRDFITDIVDNLKMLFTGKVSTNQLMGPVGISGVVAETNGIADFAYILALISLSLGVTNLLPFPALDGGKLVLLMIEAIRRKPLKENIEIGIQMAGFVILILLSIYITYNDVLRIF